ncbi:unnamed protein product [Toxocara canis]|uniref:Uncharacterized protein n=1 Tax=Toxocara canis TaxID=6265 RepID=A0A3P7GY83_TOXCA|nr:unnamed protein product [Toxocara canis]
MGQTYCARVKRDMMFKVTDENDAVFLASTDNQLARAFVEVKHKRRDKVCTLLGFVRLRERTWHDFSQTKYLQHIPAGDKICLGADGALYNRTEEPVHVMCESELVTQSTAHLWTSSTLTRSDSASETDKKLTTAMPSITSNRGVRLQQPASVPPSTLQDTTPTTEILTMLLTTLNRPTTPFEKGKESASLPQSTTFNERLPIASTLSKTIITHETGIELTSGHFDNMSSSEAMTASFHSVQAATLNESTSEDIIVERVGNNDEFMSDPEGTSTSYLAETAGSSQIHNISRPTSYQPPFTNTTGDYSMPATTTQPSTLGTFVNNQVADKMPSSPQLEEEDENEDEDEEEGRVMKVLFNTAVSVLVIEAGTLIFALLTCNDVI